MFGLFSAIGDYEWSCSKPLPTGLCVDMYFDMSLGYVLCFQSAFSQWILNYLKCFLKKLWKLNHILTARETIFREMLWQFYLQCGPTRYNSRLTNLYFHFLDLLNIGCIFWQVKIQRFFSLLWLIFYSWNNFDLFYSLVFLVCYEVLE